jgi:hypothetical protein
MKEESRERKERECVNERRGNALVKRGKKKERTNG